MTYNPAIPASSNSPAIFPAQAQGNFGRLQAIIGADHQFNSAQAPNDGYHNLVHLTIQAPSGNLSGVGRLYSKLDLLGVNQLFFMDSAGVEHQITPESTVGPIKVTGTVTLPSLGSQIIYTNAGNYQGIFIGNEVGIAIFNSSIVFRTSGVNYNQTFASQDINSRAPALTYLANDLYIVNASAASRTYQYSLTINTI